MTDRLRVGVCRFCKCTDQAPCRMPDGEPCSWVGRLCDVCSNPRCLRALAASIRKHERELLELRRVATRAPWPSQTRRQRRERERQRRQKRRAA